MAEKPVIERYRCLDLYLADEYDKEVYLASEVDSLLEAVDSAGFTIQQLRLLANQAQSHDGVAIDTFEVNRFLDWLEQQ